MEEDLKMPQQLPELTHERGVDKQRMLAGELYYSFNDPQLLEERREARVLMHQFNNVVGIEDEDGRRKVIRNLFKIPDSVSDEDLPHIEPPFYCDYGRNITFGKDVFINFNCTILDCNKVSIGNRVLFASNVNLYPATHPLDPAVRNGIRGPEYAKEIVIGDDVWIGGSVVILPGVTVGNGATIGAGSVVTKDVPPYTVVAGNPAKVVRQLPVPGQDPVA